MSPMSSSAATGDAGAATSAPHRPSSRNGKLSIWILAVGELSASLGVQIALFAVPLLAVTRFHASPMQMGILNLVDSAAALTLGLLIGATVDRLGGAVAVAVADLIRCAAVAVVGVTVIVGPSLWALYAGMFVVGAASLMHDAGVSTAVLELGGRAPRSLNRANALLRGSSVVSELTGAGLAGVLVVTLGFAASLMSGGLGFGIAALCALAALALRPTRARNRSSAPTRETTETRVRGLSGIADGVGFIWSHPVLRPLVISTVQFNFFTAAFQAVFLYYCVHDLGFGAEELAVVGIAAGVGGLLGSALVASALVNRRQKGWYLASLAAPSAALIAILLAAGQPGLTALTLVAAAEFIWALAMVICIVLFNTLRQISSPDRLVGQVAASERVLALAGELPGALLGGLVGEAVAVRLPMLAAVCGIVLSIFWLIRIPDWSRTGLEDEVET
ncbi:MFS transporter [Gryllotalpicola reticulitermitis]|uniref:MFS transporter n=1 Tax=Gryllotalpicola reticulitermitis TaxID=1184153 RepID=A0ABV8Q312_9MICO